MVAGNRVPELQANHFIDIDRTIACVEANRDVIIGIKVRAGHVNLGGWGTTPVQVAKEVAKILKLPLMVHVGEPPPLYDEVLEVLGPGDVVTHCFNGKMGGLIIEDEDPFQLAARCAAEGIRLDIGHGAASFSFEVGRLAIARGLPPFFPRTSAPVRLNRSTARSVDGDPAAARRNSRAVRQPLAPPRRPRRGQPDGLALCRQHGVDRPAGPKPSTNGKIAETEVCPGLPIRQPACISPRMSAAAA